MADVIIVMKVMPESPEVDLENLKTKAQEEIKNFGADVNNVEEKPLAFGLKSVEIEFVMDEAKGSADPLEEKLKEIEGIQSAEVISVRRLLC